jgi:hypothetical protein
MSEVEWRRLKAAELREPADREASDRSPLNHVSTMCERMPAGPNASASSGAEMMAAFSFCVLAPDPRRTIISTANAVDAISRRSPEGEVS